MVCQMIINPTGFWVFGKYIKCNPVSLYTTFTCCKQFMLLFSHNGIMHAPPFVTIDLFRKKSISVENICFSRQRRTRNWWGESRGQRVSGRCQQLLGFRSRWNQSFNPCSLYICIFVYFYFCIFVYSNF